MGVDIKCYINATASKDVILKTLACIVGNEPETIYTSDVNLWKGFDGGTATSESSGEFWDYKTNFNTKLNLITRKFGDDIYYDFCWTSAGGNNSSLTIFESKEDDAEQEYYTGPRSKPFFCATLSRLIESVGGRIGFSDYDDTIDKEVAFEDSLFYKYGDTLDFYKNIEYLSEFDLSIGRMGASYDDDGKCDDYLEKDLPIALAIREKKEISNEIKNLIKHPKKQISRKRNNGNKI